jgi:hypothetical protein
MRAHDVCNADDVYSSLRLKQSLAGRLCTEPVSAARLASVSRARSALQILAEHLAHFTRELLYHKTFPGKSPATAAAFPYGKGGRVCGF